MEHSSPSEIDFNLLYLVGWIRIWDPKCLKMHQRKVYFFKRITSPPIETMPIEHQKPMTHDVNIEDMIKANYRF